MDAGHKKALIAVLLILAGGLVIPGTVETRDPGPLPVIPAPVLAQRLDGEFRLAEGTVLALPCKASEDWSQTARIFAAKVEARTGVSISVGCECKVKNSCGGCPLRGDAGGCGKKAPAGAIIVSRGEEGCPLSDKFAPGEVSPEEGYKLHVGDAVLVEARTAHGLHNALMTLLQLIEPSEGGVVIPGADVVDQPRFEWRGMLLDSSRSFLPPDVIKRYIDLLSELKLNRFHWHIVDDQGWRIESKVFPRLHEVGGIVNNMSEKKLEALAAVRFGDDGRRLPGPRYSSVEEAARSRGYYTQEELREIVAYAAARHVMIVPEIDVPGHSTEMIAAYPELQCSGEPVEVGRVGQMLRNALCPGKEEVYQFLDKLFEELAGIFPAPYVHIGSDEVWTSEWMDAPQNQWLIEEYGYEDNDGLQSYFVSRVEEILTRHGKTMIAWDEVTSYAPEGSVVQAWRRHAFAREAAEKGLDSVISPVTHCYIDYPQLQFTQKNLYLFEPVPDGLAPDLRHHILGGEVNLWGERVTLANIDSKAFPRLVAHAEVMWSPAGARAWKDYTRRLSVVQRNMEDRGVGFGTTWREIFLLP